MNIVYYAHAGVLEHVPPEVQILSKHFDLHFLIEISPKAWKYNLLDLPNPNFQPGIYDGKPFLENHLPTDVWKMVRNAKKILLIVYPKKINLLGAKVIFEFVKYVSKNEIDLINFNGETIRAAISSIFINIPILVNVHEPRVIYESKLPISLIAKRILYSKSKHFIVHSEACKELMLTSGIATQNEITKAVLGPIKTFRAWKPNDIMIEKGFNLLYIGWITPRKGVDNLIDAVKIVSHKYANINLTIAGKPKGQVQIPISQTTMNGGRIRVIPRFISNSELVELILQSDILVLPYKEARQSSVILTAYAFFKPVIISRIKGLEEQVTDKKTGILVEPGNIVDLVNAIESLIKKPKLLENMIDNIRKSDELFLSWDNYEKNIEVAYKSAMVKK